MGWFQDQNIKKHTVAIVGLGYVGIPIAVAFSKVVKTIGYDVNEQRIEQYKQGIDPTKEVGNQEIINSIITYHTNDECLKEATFIIIAVPTPINQDKTPNLTPLIEATKSVAKHLQKGAIVVYESTVYPGVSEDVCIPLLEQITGMKVGKDFKVGYSPERINPGDKIHRLENIVKIVSGNDEEALEEIANIYALVCPSIHKAPSLKVAEAAKVAENAQRDINIAFMNELAIVFKKMNIDSKDVIAAMNTKWNALGFVPGLVGGHCIGIDPYYFIYQAENLGYHSKIILSGRMINDDMPHFVCQEIIKQLVIAKKDISKVKIAMLGITFKENCPDTRNSKSLTIIENLKEYGMDIMVVDQVANPIQVEIDYQIQLAKLQQIKDIDCLIIAVGHKEYCQLPIQQIESFFNPESQKIIIDIKQILDKQVWIHKGYQYWSL